jgi:hypothetical protein
MMMMMMMMMTFNQWDKSIRTTKFDKKEKPPNLKFKLGDFFFS